MWIYMPAIRKTRRIVSSEKGKSFMGSEFTNSDMSTPNTNDFNYKILSLQTYKEHLCWRIETVCKNADIEDENGFSKKIAWIDKKSFLCYKIEFYDFSGELYKIQTIEHIYSQYKTFFKYIQRQIGLFTFSSHVNDIETSIFWNVASHLFELRIRIYTRFCI